VVSFTLWQLHLKEMSPKHSLKRKLGGLQSRYIRDAAEVIPALNGNGIPVIQFIVTIMTELCHSISIM
jgi:hypothetical protein